jgi:hypothetical protein
MPEQDWNGFPDDTILAATDVLLVARGAGGANIPGSSIFCKGSSGVFTVPTGSDEKVRFVGTNRFLSFYNVGETTRQGYIGQFGVDQYFWNDSNGATIFGTNNTEKARILSGGNLLVGVAFSIFAAVNRGTIEVNGASSAAFGLGTGGTSAAYLIHDGTRLDIVNSRNGALVLGTNNAERARIDANGNLIVGGTSQLVSSRLSVIGSNNGAAIQCANASVGVYISNLSGTAAYQPMSFCNAGSTFAQIGSITCSATTTAYNTSSDYRLKENIVDLEDSGELIDALRPRRGNWKEDGSDFCGFIAHEFAEVFPASVQGVKDETEIRTIVDEESGDETEVEVPKMQSMQASSSEVMAVIIAELQSLRRRLAEAEAQIEALLQ